MLKMFALGIEQNLLKLRTRKPCTVHVTLTVKGWAFPIRLGRRQGCGLAPLQSAALKSSPALLCKRKAPRHGSVKALNLSLFAGTWWFTHKISRTLFSLTLCGRSKDTLMCGAQQKTQIRSYTNTPTDLTEQSGLKLLTSTDRNKWTSIYTISQRKNW